MTPIAPFGEIALVFIADSTLATLSTNAVGSTYRAAAARTSVWGSGAGAAGAGATVLGGGGAYVVVLLESGDGAGRDFRVAFAGVQTDGRGRGLMPVDVDARAAREHGIFPGHERQGREKRQ